MASAGSVYKQVFALAARSRVLPEGTHTRLHKLWLLKSKATFESLSLYLGQKNTYLSKLPA